MATLETNGLYYTGLESVEFLVRPHAKTLVPEGISIVTTEGSGSIRKSYLAKKSKVLMKYQSGWQGGSGATIKQKKFELEEFKAEMSNDKHDYYDTIQEIIVRSDGSNDITGSPIHDAELEVMSNAIVDDMNRIWWLGDKTKRHNSAGTYPDGTSFAIGDEDKHYSNINGVWTQIMADAVDYASATHEDVRRVTMSNGAVAQVDTVTVTGSSGTANVTIQGVDYLATFNTNLNTTVTDFLDDYTTILAARNITLTNAGADIVITSSIAGVPITGTAITNVSGNLAGSVAATTANVLPADLAVDEAKDTFNTMLRNASAEQKRMDKKLMRFYVTESMFENYEDTLESGVLESARKNMVDGVERYTFKGVPIIPMYIDNAIADDFQGAYPHRAILSTPENMVKVLTDGNGDSAIETWFEKKDNANMSRAQFEFGGGYVLPELLIAAY